jgi:hypothetical protein
LSALESKFQAELIKTLKRMFPGCLVLKNDARLRTGIPDLVIFWNDRWAFLEVKRSAKAPPRPLQPYYVGLAKDMSFGAFIYPENEEEVLRELQQEFAKHRR